MNSHPTISRVVSFALTVALLLSAPHAWGHVTLIDPDGGETLQIGSQFTIEWRVEIQHDTQNWDLYYSKTGGTGIWIPIAVNLPVGDPTAGSIHTYAWTVPDDATNQARVRVVQDNSFQPYEDISRNNFSIVVAEADTAFLDIDLIHIPNPGKATTGVASAIPELAGIVVLCSIPDEDATFVRTLVVDGNTGATVFGPVDSYHPPDPCYPPEPGYPPDPGRVLFSQHFLPGTVIVMHADNSLSFLPLTFAPDHPPDPGLWGCVQPPDDQLPWGLATAITELPGSEFDDGLPRLFIGTDMGQILVMTEDPTGGPAPVLSEVFDLTGGAAISSLGPIPQVGVTLLGVATGNEVMGVDPTPFAPLVLFQFSDAAGSPISDFVAQRSGNPPDDGTPVNLVLVDGIGIDIKLATIPASATGTGMLNFFLQQPPPDDTAPVSQIASGSLLMLVGDSSGVWYDPGFDVTTGPSSCATNLMDEFAVPCSCCEGRVGDANSSGVDEPTIGDISVLIDAKFIAGSCDGIVDCMVEADINQSGGSGAGCDDITIGDISYLIDYLFITGPSLGLPDCL